MKIFSSGFELYPNAEYTDKGLLLSMFVLISFGLVAVATSSLDFAGEVYGDPWLFVKKQTVFLLMGIVLGFFVAAVPTHVWSKFSGVLVLAAIVLLAIVLIPGIGRSVNGSRRWLALGFITIQASEAAKFGLILFFASYLSRRQEEVKQYWFAFFKMLVVLGVVVCLLLLEPDFGSAVVICLTIGAMMFVASVPVFRFMLLAAAGLGGFVAMAVFSPYRWERLITFMDPWARQFDTGYQLVQSLIAFGRGEWFGLGLGNSLQKLFFLPEAHTDFVFSILAEEFGLIGISIVIAVYVFFIKKMLGIAQLARQQDKAFCSYLVFGIAVMLAIQAFINMGVASGFLPTKGLTLPFISYGGSSLLITCALVALVFRVNWELHEDG